MALFADDAGALAQSGLIDFLSIDPRPTFVLRRAGPYPGVKTLIFANNACRRTAPSVRNLLECQLSCQVFSPLDRDTTTWLHWVEHSSENDSTQHGGVIWERFKFAGDLEIITSSSPVNSVPVTERLSEIQAMFDHALGSGCMSAAYHKLLSDVDWDKTSVGKGWSLDIRQAISLTLSNTEPCCVCVGRDRVLIYNEPYTALIGNLHPAALGQSAKITFDPIWERFEVLMQEAEDTGRTVYQKDNAVPIMRSDSKAEWAYFSYAYAPIKDAAGQFCGIYNEVSESTLEVVGRFRRLNSLRIGEATSAMVPIDKFWINVLQSFDFDDSEVPFAAIYVRDRGPDRYDSPPSKPRNLTLQGSIGWKTDFGALPTIIDLAEDSKWSQVLREMTTEDGPRLFGMQAVLTGSRASVPPTSEDTRVIVCALDIPALNSTAWVVYGVKHLRPYDDDYEMFMRLLSRQIVTGASSVASYLAEKHNLEQNAELARMEKERLSQELAIKRREAEEHAWRFMGFAQHAPVGVYVFGPQGEVNYANEAWYNLFGIPYKQQGDKLWRDHIHPEDMAIVDQKWAKLAEEGIDHAHFEFRVCSDRETLISDPESAQIRHLSSSCFAEMDDSGNFKSVTGVVIDVSIHKTHEREVAERLASALEAKRAQENFMDMVSHEMRNPLNAILQCAEEAAQLLEPCAGTDECLISRDTAVATLEAVNTILYCGTHQKHIIDDVLTISKLDSKLLTLAPTSSNPVEVAQQALQIYRSETRTSQIQVTVKASKETSSAVVSFDAGRVLQILINLVGNAVKFVKKESRRKLVVSVSVSEDRPRPKSISFVTTDEHRRTCDPQRKRKQSAVADPEEVFVYFSVEDTGPGLTAEEMKTLFGRFKQANPRTHAQYGGSGLGLFISRELTELQGGEIGLASEPGKGSTFAFYVAAKRLGSKSNTPSLRSGEFALLPTAEPDSPGAGITILVVEDNAINQAVLARQLRRAGFGVATADNGEQALERLQSPNDVALVLCDLEMPVMDGLTCVRRVVELRDEGKMARVPMVAITGNARAEQVKVAREAGFDDVVCKPYSFTKLVPLIRSVVGRG